MRTKTFKRLCRIFLFTQTISVLGTLVLLAVWFFRKGSLSNGHLILTLVAFVALFFSIRQTKVLVKKSYDKWQQKKEIVEEAHFGKLR
jgi:hypothetical protein